MLIILASQWDPIAVPALSVQRAIFLVLEILIQDPRNQVQHLSIYRRLSFIINDPITVL